MTNVAVVILNYNGRELLQRFLPSVMQHSASTRIVVADNGSTDGSQELITRDFPGVELMTLATNLGFCGGYTTFSTFSMETLALIEGGNEARAALYVAVSVTLSLAAAWLGSTAARALSAAGA